MQWKHIFTSKQKNESVGADEVMMIMHACATGALQHHPKSVAKPWQWTLQMHLWCLQPLSFPIVHIPISHMSLILSWFVVKVKSRVQTMQQMRQHFGAALLHYHHLPKTNWRHEQNLQFTTKTTSPWKNFKLFWGLRCIWRYGEAQGVQEVQKNTFGKYSTEGIPR